MGIIRLLINIMCVVIPVLVFIVAHFSVNTKQGRLSYSYDKRKKAILGKEDERKSSTERITLFLSMNGVNYRMKKEVPPQEFLAIRIVFAILLAGLGGIAAASFSVFLVIICVIAAGIFGYFLPVIYYSAVNYDDNKKMLTDIHTAYDTLRCYLAVQLPMIDTLEECYLRVGNKRLKKAFYELKEGLKTKMERGFVLDTFRLKFKNTYIDQLAITITQYYKTGDVSAMLEDLSEQMVAIDHAVNMTIKNRLETKSMIVQLLVFLGLLGGVFVALMQNLGSVMSGMF